MLVAVLEVAASVHGCDLKHSGWLQLENPANLLLDTASPLTVPTNPRPASNAFSTTTSFQRRPFNRLASAVGVLDLGVLAARKAAVVHLSRPANRLDECKRKVSGRLTRCVEATYRCGCYSEAHQPWSLPIVKSHIDWLRWCSSTANNQTPPETPNSEKDWAHQLSAPQHKAAFGGLCGQD